MRKKMPKILATLCSLLLAVSLFGCAAGDTQSGDSAPAPAPSAESAAPSTADEPATAESSDVTLVVASVNNGPMMVMEELSSKFTEETGIKVQYTMMTENDIRSKIQQDVAVGGGQFDLVTLGTSDTGTYCDSGWTIPLQPYFDKMSDEEKAWYDYDDLIPAVMPAYSSPTQGVCSLPLYGESTMIMYRKDLFDEKGLTMPNEPSWDQIYDFATQLNDPANDMVGMALRGKAGYGENMYVFGTILYAFGAQWFDMSWQPMLETPEMKAAWEFYNKLQTDAGAKGVTSNGYTETLNLMASGNAAIYYDATVSAAVFEAEDSPIKGKMGYALAPSGPGKGNTMTIGGWGLSITSGSKNADAAFKYLTWVTSKDYINLVGESKGWINVPSGSRTSTYQSADYKSVAPFADITLQSISNCSFDHPAVNETPYTGNSLPNIPEYGSIGEQVGQKMSDYLTGGITVDQALADSQKVALDAMMDGGYIS